VKQKAGKQKEKIGRRLKQNEGNEPRGNLFIQQYFVKSITRNKEEGINQGINKPINGKN
jgi:hypothetical protein